MVNLQSGITISFKCSIVPFSQEYPHQAQGYYIHDFNQSHKNPLNSTANQAHKPIGISK